MKVELVELAKIMEKDCFVNYLSSMLVMYQDRQSRYFQPYDTMFTCYDLLTVLKANNDVIRPPMEEWGSHLLQWQKIELFEMICAGKSLSDIDKRAFKCIEKNYDIYRVKKQLYDRVLVLDLEPQVIAENVYKQLTK